MNLKKALSLIAFGFLFTLVNINLTLNGATVNVMPAFVGWLLFFLAFGHLGSYGEGKTYLKWIALVLAVITGFIWLMELAGSELNTSILSWPVQLLTLVFMYLLFVILEQLAKDYGSALSSTIRSLRILNLILYAAFLLLSVGVVVLQNVNFAVFPLLIGFALLVCAVVTAVVLFRLRREIGDKASDQP